jgi:hypothetical protein
MIEVETWHQKEYKRRQKELVYKIITKALKVSGG